jgi:hypothetical protein
MSADGGQSARPPGGRLRACWSDDPAKAVELLLDAKRGDEWALIWIRVLRRNRKG